MYKLNISQSYHNMEFTFDTMDEVVAFMKSALLGNPDASVEVSLTKVPDDAKVSENE